MLINIIFCVILGILLIICLGFLFKIKSLNEDIKTIKYFIANPIQAAPFTFDFEVLVQELNKIKQEYDKTNNYKCDSLQLMLEKLYVNNYKVFEDYLNNIIKGNFDGDAHIALLICFTYSSLIKADCLIIELYLHHLFKTRANNDYIMSYVLSLLEFTNNLRFSKQFQGYSLPNKSLHRRLITLHNIEMRNIYNLR